MHKLVVAAVAVLALALFTVGIQPHTAADAACPQTPADCHRQHTPTPVPVATATPVPATVQHHFGNSCEPLDFNALGITYVRDRFNQCVPLQPAAPQVVCNTGNVITQLVPNPYAPALPYGYNATYPGAYGVNPYIAPGFSNYGQVGAQVVTQCNAPIVAPTPAVQNIYIPVPQAAAAPVVAPSLPAPSYSYGTIKAPSTGSGGLLVD
jgi:hypothetical protein